MYNSVEQRIEKLEKQVAKQNFQIFLLTNIAMNPTKYALYFEIISTEMSEQTFNELRRLTKEYEAKLQAGQAILMSDFVHQFSKILTADAPQLAADLASFIPRWLGGVNGGVGFSNTLYEYFY